VKAQPGSTNPFTLATSPSGGLFSMYSISLSGGGTTTLSGTTANGATVKYQLTASSSNGFETITLPQKFSGLTSVTWNPGSLLFTNIVATETLAPSSASAPVIPGVAGSHPIAAQTIVVNSDTGKITINGVDSGGTFNGAAFTEALIDSSTVVQFTFNGDLNIPDNSTVIGTGSKGISLYALNNVNVGSGVAFHVNAVGAQSGPGGGAGGAGGGQAGGGGANGGVGSTNAPLLSGFGSGWQYNGNATLGNNGVLFLTHNNQNEDSSAFDLTPIDPSIGFSASFIYEVAGDANANGMTFEVQDDPRGVFARGRGGHDLGYADDFGQIQITPSVAVALNLFDLAGRGTALDFNGGLGGYTSTQQPP
jgi:hypothetical protein